MIECPFCYGKGYLHEEDDDMIIPIPTHVEIEIEVDREADPDKVKRYWFDTVDWMCPTCRSVMFGRMTYCVYCRAKGLSK